MEKVKVKVVNKSKGKLPKYETAKSAGMDVRAALSYMDVNSFGDTMVYGGFAKDAKDPKDRKVIIRAGGRALIPTGLFVEIPDGHELQVRPRSGLAIKKGITVLNSPGTIDSDYRGEVGVILINHSTDTFIVEDGDRIAQLVLKKVEQIDWSLTDKLGTTKRGEGGFNSTGTK